MWDENRAGHPSFYKRGSEGVISQVFASVQDAHTFLMFLILTDYRRFNLISVDIFRWFYWLFACIRVIRIYLDCHVFEWVSVTLFHMQATWLKDIFCKKHGFVFKMLMLDYTCENFWEDFEVVQITTNNQQPP